MNTHPHPRPLLAVVAAYAQTLEEHIQEDLTTVLQQRPPLLEEVLRYALLNGGKRLRPLLTLLCSRLCGRHDHDLYRLALACEYLHVATLIHDDVLDQADTRRGKESVVKQYGLSAAILAGDWLHARSLYLVGRLAGNKGLDIYFHATDNMVAGEFLQMQYLANPLLDEAEYFTVIEQKTAGLMASACGLGAVYGGATATQQAALMEYGRRLGRAFQIIDDLLDYQGQEEATGKEIGKDFLEGKITLPLIHSLREATAPERAFILTALEERTQDNLAALCRLMAAKQSFAYSLQQAEEEVAAALAALASWQGQEQGILSDLALYLLKRDH